MFENPSSDEIASILRHAHTIAVVGLSDNPERESYAVAQEMQKRGYQIIPVNPNVPQVLGEKSYPSLAAIPQHVDIVNVFRRSEFLSAVVEEVNQTQIPVIWAQQGVYNEEAAHLAQQQGKVIVMDRCIMVMHSLFVKSQSER